MAVAHGKPKYTYDDYAKLPEGERVELIGGEFLVSPAPGTRHQRISRIIGYELCRWLEGKNLGEALFAPTDVVLSPHDVVQPDLLFVSKSRANIITEANIQGAPDLIIEILSPGNEKREMIIKKALYEQHGVREYWIVDPEAQAISAYDLQGEFLLRKICGKDEILTSSILPGFELSLSKLFTP